MFKGFTSLIVSRAVRMNSLVFLVLLPVLCCEAYENDIEETETEEHELVASAINQIVEKSFENNIKINVVDIFEMFDKSARDLSNRVIKRIC